MNNKNAQTNHGQQATTIHNAAVYFWARTSLTPIEELMQRVPPRYQSQFEHALRDGDQTAIDLIAAIKAKAIGFKQGKVERQFASLDYMCAAMFGGYFFLWAAVSLMLLQYHLTPLQQMQVLGVLCLTTSLAVWAVVHHVVPQLIAKRFTSGLQAAPIRVTEA